jgi:DNA invertase Pin-like site-specific DNA recombinase
MQIGYARVSTKDHSFDLQTDAQREAGCEKIYREVVSGTKAKRPVLDGLLQEVRPRDVLVIWKLDRLGRSLRHLVELAGTLMERDVGLKSLNDPIDTTTPQGRLIFNLFASLAEFERDLRRLPEKKYQDAQDFCSSSRSGNRRIAGLCNCCRNAEDGRKDKQAGMFFDRIRLIRGRTQAGLSAARARGREGGRPKGLPPQAERTAYAAETLYRERKLPVREIAEKLGIAKSTLYEYLRHRGVPIGQQRPVEPAS